jgi:hypothetical protein
VCETCEKYCSKMSINSPAVDQLCSRFGFNELEPSMFPGFLHAHLTQRSIEEFLEEHSDGYKEGSFFVYVTVGSKFDSMGFEVQFLEPKGEDYESELLKQHHLTTMAEENKSRMVSPRTS